MRVLVISPGQDTGGMGIRIKTAFDKHAVDWTARAVRSTANFIDYPADVETYRAPRSAVEALYAEADVVHCSNSIGPIRRYGHGKQKPAVVTYQGTAFRTTPDLFLKESRRYRAIQTASTLDLVTLGQGEVRWSPHPIDIDAMQALRRGAARRPERIVIHHSPTNRRVKSTAAFMDAARRLETEDARVKVQLVEAVTWKENLRLKARADIVYDQVILGWGTNALEAWAMGIPVIAGTEFQRVRDHMIETLGELPMFEATADTIYDALRTLVNDADLRRLYGQRGLDYIRRFHAEDVAVRRLEGFYTEARAA